MPDIVTDISINQNWNARKGANNPVTFTFTQSAAAFNISTYTFSVQLRKFGSSTNLLNLTQGSGITNNGAAGTLNVVFTSANLTNLVANDYYWQMTVVHPDTFSYLWYQGTFNLYSETYTGDLTSTVTGTIDLNGTTINTAITLGVGGGGGASEFIDLTDVPSSYSGQGSKLVRVNAGATSLEFFTPSYLTSLSNGNGTTANGSAVDLGGTVTTNTYINSTQSAGTPYWNKSYIKTSGYVELGNEVYADYSSLTGDRLVTALYSTTGGAGYYLRHYNSSNVLTNEFTISGNGIGLNLGSDATGDIYYRNSSGYLTRLGVGTNGHVLTLAGGIPSWAAPSGGGLTVGTSTITSGTNTRVLYNNSGVLGEYTVSGSGDVAMTTSPTFTTPILGTPTSGTLTNTTGYLFNNLAAATGSSTINNAANAIEWQWNTLGAGTGLLLSSSSTSAASNTQTVFRVNQTGANSTTTQTTYAGYFSNTKTGTLSTNYGIYATASGATNNYALYANGLSRLNDILFVGGAIYTTSASTRLDIRGATSVAYGIAIGNAHTSTNTSVNHEHLSIQTAWSGSSVTNTFKYFSGIPTINITSGTGTLIGYDWSPTLTSVAGISNHYAIRATSGKVLLAGLPTSAAGLATGEIWNNSGVLNIV